MFLAIGILLVQHITFVAYLFDSYFFQYAGSQNARSMLFFIGAFSLLLSLPTIVWNHSMMKTTMKGKDIAGFVLAIVVASVAALMFGTWYVTGIHNVGGTVF